MINANSKISAAKDRLTESLEAYNAIAPVGPVFVDGEPPRLSDDEFNHAVKAIDHALRFTPRLRQLFTNIIWEVMRRATVQLNVRDTLDTSVDDLLLYVASLELDVEATRRERDELRARFGG